MLNKEDIVIRKSYLRWLKIFFVGIVLLFIIEVCRLIQELL